MRKKCLAWKSGLAGAIAREKMTIFLAWKTAGSFYERICDFPFLGDPIFEFLDNLFGKNCQKSGFLAVSSDSGASSELPASKLLEISTWIGLMRFSMFLFSGFLFCKSKNLLLSRQKSCEQDAVTFGTSKGFVIRKNLIFVATILTETTTIIASKPAMSGE